MISIIIPVYNVADYLGDCLNSIISQSIVDYEIILINDGSTDSSAEICDRYKSCYDNIIVFHQENSGVSVARNKGLELARGEYVMFIDGDDTLFEVSLSAVERVFTDNVDCYIFNSLLKEKEVYPFPKELDRKIVLAQMLYSKYGYSRGSVWGVVYSKSFLDKNNIRFLENIANSEDTVFFSYVQYYATEIYLCSLNLYDVRVRPGSASRSWSENRIRSCFSVFDRLALDFKQRGIDYSLSPILNYLIYRLLSGVVNKIVNFGNASIYSQFKDVILKSELYPINLKGIVLLRNKVRLANYSLDLYYILSKLKNLK